MQNALRMWAAQSLWFDRIWRITESGERIDAPWRDSTKARDVPRLLYVQLDYSMEVYIMQLEARLLASLDMFVFKRSSSTWFSVYAAAFVYLVTLENDSWRLETWKVKLKAWENLRPVILLRSPISIDCTNLSKDIRESLPVWPLQNDPDFYLEQNRYHAHIVAAHVRACCKGLFPFSMNASGQVIANTNSTDKDIKEFIENIQDEFGGFGMALTPVFLNTFRSQNMQLMISDQNVLLRRAVPSFRPEDVNSLDYTFTAKLLTDDE